VLVDVAVVVEVADRLGHATLELGVDVVVRGRLAVGAGRDRRLELVDLAGGVLQLPRDVVLGAGVRRRSRVVVSVRGHAVAPRDLTGLPVAGLATAPLAVFPQRDAIRRVALALIGLIVAPLAILAGEGHSNAHVTAGHNGLPCKGLMKMIEPAPTRG